MASEERGARSDAIRQYLAKHPSAGPAKIVEDLKQAGVEVSKNLVGSIKYRKTSKGARRPGRRAGRPRSSGSEAIRRILAKTPDAGPKAIRAELAKKGVHVSPGLVSFVKFKFKNGDKTPAVRVAARKTSAQSISFDQLIEVKRIADSLGGTDQLRRALDMLAQLS